MHKLLAKLRATVAGEVRSDALYRAIYSTDASIYQITPDVVVLPRTVADVAATVRACAEHRVPVTPRGAGTGLTGGCVNRGVLLDCSRRLNRVLAIDPAARIANVEPGVVLDELNAELRPHGLHFAPDVATGSRATVGGMIANNSCGAHSVLHGRTVDHVLAVDCILSDGTRHRWGIDDPAGRGAGTADETAAIRNELAFQCEQTLYEILGEYADEIAARFPKVMRRNGGYALDRLLAGDDRPNVETIVCGSEGTLCVVVGATLKLTPLPPRRGLVVAHFHELLAALEAVPRTLEHRPAAVELLDTLILGAARANPAMRRRPWRIEGDPQGILIIELYDDSDESLTRRLGELADDLATQRMGYAWPILSRPQDQDELWNIRKSGLGLLMSRPGDRQTYDFVEDTAVDPSRLCDYIARFMSIMSDEGVSECSYYAHASVGCLHVKPILNLRRRDDVQRMYRIADRISSLALEFGGTMTGEHGDGIVRSCWLEKMYGPRLTEAFRKVKRTFDPLGILNPGKIVDPLPMTANLRFDHPVREPPGETALDFTQHGGMAGLAGMCSGLGQCRQRLVGTMCPSYVATGDELHTTRARANALRMALSDHGLLDGLSDPALDEVMDLCLSCKACKTECPTGVDMARLKSQWLSERRRHRGTSPRDRLIGAMPTLAKWGSRFAPPSNWLARSRIFRGVSERLFGLDRRVPPPKYARQSFRQWFVRHRTLGIRNPKSAIVRQVVLFIDTWTDCCLPSIGIAAVRVLEAMGHQVIVPPTVCCARPAISKGMLAFARKKAARNVAVLGSFAEADVPILGLEPSCILTLVDELPQLVRSPAARQIARCAMMIETYLESQLGALQSLIQDPQGAILYHGHCHQKALVGTSAAMRVLSACGAAREINSGCCGMAGSFGHEVEHYEIARLVGEQRLFPAVRARGPAQVVVSGFSCRHQIEHHTGASAKHVVETLADALGAPR